MSIRKVKATDSEKSEYSGVYPLHHWLVDDKGNKIAVEDLRCWGPEDPHWEAVAPKGMIFGDYETHSLLGVTQKHLHDRVEAHELVKCPGSIFCECGVDNSH